MRERDRAEAAELLRRVLALADAGDLSADGSAGAAMVRRLEGALISVNAQPGGVLAPWPERKATEGGEDGWSLGCESL
jgi:hypothetical protein